jgi:hypothetical protein
MEEQRDKNGPDIRSLIGKWKISSVICYLNTPCMSRFFILIYTVFAINICVAAPPDTLKTRAVIISSKKAALKEVAALPKVLKEASGLEYAGNYLWSHNDDGIPALYCLDSAANLVKAVQLNSVNRGWEDLTRDDNGNIYIGGFGNNKNDKKELKIYRIPDPSTITEAVTTPEIILYSYSDQKHFPPDKTNKNFDVDAFFEWNGSLYLFTKNRSAPFVGYSKIYRLPAEPGPAVAQLIDSVYVGDGPMINNWITGADISPDKKTVVLLFHDRIWFIRNFADNRFSSGRIYQLNLDSYTHKAGICFKDDETLYIVDELEAGILGGKLYTLDIRDIRKDLR